MNLKEIKKPSGKSLRVWAKNQLRFAIFEKILKFTYKNLKGKLIFYPFSLPSSRTFVILYTSATYQNLCGSGRGVVLLRAWGGTFEFGGSGVLYKSLRFMLFYIEIYSGARWEIFHRNRKNRIRIVIFSPAV